ncbi:uncharacterized mitochondrial protein AtMg01250-like [Lycium barbarum]|uniref:uncharacterized mitochondrial protein AtMg01250-like n=1 Tax=Lycium barbarum TaxID=112863 RepID=UPI00293F2E20|nr:uncharacterized mitochondrial protein AtMg01250-like [Lycium barbarum]
MHEIGFPDKFIQWTMECVQTVSYSILVNGEPTQPFEAARGLRQGDPMSPFLFAIGMEYLSRLLYGLPDVKSFQFHPRCAKLNISHLCFAYDLLLFSRGELTSITALHKSFTEFSLCSGIQENHGRNAVYFGGVSVIEQNQIMQHLGYCFGELPFKYLGVPLATKKISIIQWQPLVDKITS